MSRRQEATLPKRLGNAISFLCGQLQMVGLFYIGVSKLAPLNRDYQEDPSAIAEAAK
jgi:hypothetical protein